MTSFRVDRTETSKHGAPWSAWDGLEVDWSVTAESEDGERLLTSGELSSATPQLSRVLNWYSDPVFENTKRLTVRARVRADVERLIGALNLPPDAPISLVLVTLAEETRYQNLSVAPAVPDEVVIESQHSLGSLAGDVRCRVVAVLAHDTAPRGPGSPWRKGDIVGCQRDRDELVIWTTEPNQLNVGGLPVVFVEFGADEEGLLWRWNRNVAWSDPEPRLELQVNARFSHLRRLLSSNNTHHARFQDAIALFIAPQAVFDLALLALTGADLADLDPDETRSRVLRTVARKASMAPEEFAGVLAGSSGRELAEVAARLRSGFAQGEAADRLAEAFLRQGERP